MQPVLGLLKRPAARGVLARRWFMYSMYVSFRKMGHEAV